MSDTATATEATETETAAPAVEAAPEAVETETSTENETEDARIKRANTQAAKYRTDLRAVESELQETKGVLAKLAAVFNPEAGENADPATQLASITGEAESLRNENARLKAEAVVRDLSADPAVNANAVALLDSRSFTDSLHALDATADDYRELVANAIKDAISKNANLAAAGQGPSRGGAPGAGTGPAAPAGAVTQEQFDAMDYQGKADLYRTNPDLYRRLSGRS